MFNDWQNGKKRENPVLFFGTEPECLVNTKLKVHRIRTWRFWSRKTRWQFHLLQHAETPPTLSYVFPRFAGFHFWFGRPKGKLRLLFHKTIITDIANSTSETSYSHNEKINITDWQKGKLQMFYLNMTAPWLLYDYSKQWIWSKW